ncbi:urease accessory protein UreE [Aquamicrobium sp. LC103]|uniref:urease accessory protein UreE n=1 Tax=Aquamicrobium sp. LC103 TaxID=1120658 RepID=UPI00063E9F1D|nr:urease accessory protein UreE [Aquamicrobium sp. LC103]TKT82417.1 urease accessory protein UreE [Aquamicrobium sp. LC103]
MKLSINRDFTKFSRVTSIVEAEKTAGLAEPFDTAILPHDERHLRRKVIELKGGERVFIDLAEPVHLGTGDRLMLEDGRNAAIAAAEEELYEIAARDRLHLARLCWHIGNRHLAAQIDEDRILILRDHVIKAMLEGLGATVREIVGSFEPVRGAYSGHGHSHGHDHHHHDHDHGHEHGHHHHHHD